MPFIVTFQEPGYVHAVYEGHLDMASMQAYLSSVAEALKEHDCRRVLSDYRRAVLGLSMLDFYELPRLIMQRGRNMGIYPLRIRRALIIHPQAYEKFRFFETVSLNKAQNVKLFTEEAKAREWLLGE